MTRERQYAERSLASYFQTQKLRSSLNGSSISKPAFTNSPPRELSDIPRPSLQCKSATGLPYDLQVRSLRRCCQTTHDAESTFPAVRESYGCLRQNGEHSNRSLECRRAERKLESVY